MASISSVISLFVLLLATYCYSVPIGTEFEYSTVHSGFATDKTIVERDTLPLTSSFEETTVDPRIHIKRTGSVGHDKSDESDEFTTERSILTEDKKQKRNFFDETTSKIVERSDEIKPIDNVVVEETTIDPRIHIKRTVSVGHDKSDESDEFTTERSILTEDKKQKRNFFDETTSKIVERSEENETSDNVIAEDDKSIKVDDTLPEKREDEHIIFDITTSYVPSEESKVERNIDLDLVNTIESSTEFNARASRFMENESDVSVFTEPTSSFESLAHSTGLLHSRTIPETEEHKIEGTFEEDHTTFKPNY